MGNTPASWSPKPSWCVSIRSGCAPANSSSRARSAKTRCKTFFSYFNADPDNVRNKVDIGGGELYDIGCYAIATARFIFDAEPERVIGSLDTDPKFGTDRLCGGLLIFSENRQLTFTCSTQLVPYQRVQICGTKGRIEVEIPFQRAIDTNCRRDSLSTTAATSRNGNPQRAAAGLRSIYAAGRGLRARGHAAAALALSDRERRGQHARHRRAVPFGTSGKWGQPGLSDAASLPFHPHDQRSAGATPCRPTRYRATWPQATPGRHRRRPGRIHRRHAPPRRGAR